MKSSFLSDQSEVPWGQGYVYLVSVIPAPENLAQGKHLVSVELAKQLNDEAT